MTRWLKFSVVGLMGIAVQLVALQIFVKLGMHYLLATGLAVEIALLHNYAWHRKWTWALEAYAPYRLLRFHVANGLISLISNLLWMRLLTGWLGVPPLAANLIAIGATAVLNFVLADRWVFAAAKFADEEVRSFDAPLRSRLGATFLIQNTSLNSKTPTPSRDRKGASMSERR